MAQQGAGEWVIVAKGRRHFFPADTSDPEIAEAVGTPNFFVERRPDGSDPNSRTGVPTAKVDPRNDPSNSAYRNPAPFGQRVIEALPQIGGTLGAVGGAVADAYTGGAAIPSNPALVAYGTMAGTGLRNYLDDKSDSALGTAADIATSGATSYVGDRVLGSLIGAGQRGSGRLARWGARELVGNEPGVAETALRENVLPSFMRSGGYRSNQRIDELAQSAAPTLAGPQGNTRVKLRNPANRPEAVAVANKPEYATNPSARASIARQEADMRANATRNARAAANQGVAVTKAAAGKNSPAAEYNRANAQAFLRTVGEAVPDVQPQMDRLRQLVPAHHALQAPNRVVQAAGTPSQRLRNWAFSADRLVGPGSRLANNVSNLNPRTVNASARALYALTPDQINAAIRMLLGSATNAPIQQPAPSH